MTKVKQEAKQEQAEQTNVPQYTQGQVAMGLDYQGWLDNRATRFKIALAMAIDILCEEDADNDQMKTSYMIKAIEDISSAGLFGDKALTLDQTRKDNLLRTEAHLKAKLEQREIGEPVPLATTVQNDATNTKG